MKNPPQRKKCDKIGHRYDKEKYCIYCRRPVEGYAEEIEKPQHRREDKRGQHE